MKKGLTSSPGQPGGPGFLAVGQVLRPHGVKGGVKLRPDTDDPERFLGFEALFQETKSGVFAPVPLKNVSVRGGFVYLTLGEDAGAEDAEKRRGLVLYIDRAHAAPLKEHENYIADLIGCLIVDTQGREIGRLKDIMQPGANDVYVVDTSRGEMLIPALRHVILRVDVEQKLIMADESRLSEVAVLAD